MKTIIIIGGTREAAYKKLEETARNDGIVHHDWYHEAEVDGYRLMAIGGEAEDVCFLVGAGFQGVEIVTVEEEAISEPMWGRIRTVRSACAAGQKGKREVL